MDAMSRGSDSQPLAVEDTEAIAELRSLLSGADYTVSGITRLLDLETVTLSPVDIPVHERRLIPDNQLSTLIGLFLLGLTVDADQAGRALAPPLYRRRAPLA